MLSYERYEYVLTCVRFSLHVRFLRSLVWPHSRFGAVALTESERAGLWIVFSDRPDLLLTIVKELVKFTGVR